VPSTLGLSATLLALFAPDPGTRAGHDALDPAEVVPGADDERAHHLAPPIARERSKKDLARREKLARPPLRVTDADLDSARRAARAHRPKRAIVEALMLGEVPAPGARALPLTTLFNLRTREALPMVPGLSLDNRFHAFLRCHFTNQATEMDGGLIEILGAVAARFEPARIEVVSGYRSPKYNLMLRKKGREVARDSQHTHGNAVDFRIRGVPTKRLLQFTRSLKRGGVGFYPNSQFVHSDVGRVRFWRGS
jgi:hypothetical protein